MPDCLCGHFESCEKCRPKRDNDPGPGSFHYVVGADEAKSEDDRTVMTLFYKGKVYTLGLRFDDDMSPETLERRLKAQFKALLDTLKEQGRLL